MIWSNLIPNTLRLGESNEARQDAYRKLFKHQLSENSIAEIREALNKAWALGNDRFKQRIQGGDRKSKQFNAKLVVSLGGTA